MCFSWKQGHSFCNCSIITKIKKSNTDFNLQKLFKFYQQSQQCLLYHFCFLSGSGSNSGLQVAFNFHESLVSFYLERFPSLKILTYFLDHMRSVFRCVPHSGFAWCFLTRWFLTRKPLRFWCVLLNTSHVILLCVTGFPSPNTVYCVDKVDRATLRRTSDDFWEEESFLHHTQGFYNLQSIFFHTLMEDTFISSSTVSVNFKKLSRLQNAWTWGPFYRFLKGHLSKCKYQETNCKTTPMSSSKPKSKTGCWTKHYPLSLSFPVDNLVLAHLSSFPWAQSSSVEVAGSEVLKKKNCGGRGMWKRMSLKKCFSWISHVRQIGEDRTMWDFNCRIHIQLVEHKWAKTKALISHQHAFRTAQGVWSTSGWGIPVPSSWAVTAGAWGVGTPGLMASDR